MKFDYLVKHDGIYYPAGTDVPIETSGGGETPAVSVSGKVEEPVAEVKETKPEPAEKKGRKYSEEDLNMPYMSLKSIARSEGFKVPNTAKAEEIKEMLRTL